MYKALLKDSHVVGAYLCDDKIISRCLMGGVDMKDIILINRNSDTFLLL